MQVTDLIRVQLHRLTIWKWRCRLLRQSSCNKLGKLNETPRISIGLCRISTRILGSTLNSNPRTSLLKEAMQYLKKMHLTVKRSSVMETRRWFLPEWLLEILSWPWTSSISLGVARLLLPETSITPLTPSSHVIVIIQLLLLLIKLPSNSTKNWEHQLKCRTLKIKDSRLAQVVASSRPNSTCLSMTLCIRPALKCSQTSENLSKKIRIDHL